MTLEKPVWVEGGQYKNKAEVQETELKQVKPEVITPVKPEQPVPIKKRESDADLRQAAERITAARIQRDLAQAARVIVATQSCTRTNTGQHAPDGRIAHRLFHARNSRARE